MHSAKFFFRCTSHGIFSQFFQHFVGTLNLLHLFWDDGGRVVLYLVQSGDWTACLESVNLLMYLVNDCSRDLRLCFPRSQF